MVLAHKLEAKLIILFIMEKFPTGLPRQRNGDGVQLVPADTALARTVDATISTATDITLNDKTSIIEVTALDQGVYLKYATGVTAANFDEYIHADSTRHYVIPQGCTVVSVIERVATAGVIVIEK